MTDLKELINLLSTRDSQGICETLNKYFGQEDVCELLSADDDRCREFIETVRNVNRGLEWFLARISLVKQQEISKKRERDESSEELSEESADKVELPMKYSKSYSY